MPSSSDFLSNAKELMRLDSGSPTPLYHKLYTLLKSRILDGSIGHGTKLPSEEEFAEVFGVSRITTKRAMDELAADGLVERRRGKGTHVIHHYKPKAVNAPLTGMLENLESMALETKVKKVLFCKKVVPPAEIRYEFGIDENTTLFKVIRVRSESNQAFSHYTTWTLGVDALFNKKLLKSNSRISLMKAHNITFSHVEQTLSAVPAPEDVAIELDVEQGSPLLSLTRRSYNQEDQLIDLLYGLYHPGRFQYQMSLSPN